MRTMLRVAMVVGSLLALSEARAEDWPRWRGPRGDGISQETGLLEKWPASFKPIWTADVGQGYAGPVAQGGKIYLFSTVNGKDTLTCYDAESGKPVWSESYDGGWTGSYPGTRATPNIDGDKIYTWGGLGDLVGRDLGTGKLLWKTNVLREVRSQPLNWAQASNPTIDGDLIYVQSGQGGPVVVAVNKNDGKIAWRSQAAGSGAYGHPIIAEIEGKKQLIAVGSDGPTGMDPATGKTLWHYRWGPGNGVIASDPVYRDGNLFITSAYGQGSIMLKLSAQGAQKVWEKRDVTGRFQPSILDGDYLYVNSEGTLKCLAWKTGEIKWSSPKEEKNLLGIGGSMVRLPGEKAILLSMSGRLTLAKMTPAGFERISDVPGFVEGREVFATPTVYNGKLYAKGDKELVCVDLKAQ